MFKTFNIFSVCVKTVQNNSARSIGLRSAAKLWSIYFREKPETTKPPYNYICQIGNPVLREKATPVDPKVIQTDEFQKVLDHLHKLMEKYDTIGLAAPQIGLSWQVFAMKVDEQSISTIHPYIRNYYNIVSQPLTYFINPTMEITNPEEVVLYETCASIEGYCAEVPRAKEIQIKALDRNGEPFSLKLEGWLARIVQHEMDHLDGHVYTDRMYLFTFDCKDWKQEEENEKKATLN